MDTTKVLKLVKDREKEGSKWIEVIGDIQHAQMHLFNYELVIQVKRNKPTYGLVTFVYESISAFDALKKYTGEYGFVVPVKGGANNKVLRGEKKLKYK